jgi:hypothetical protein
MATFSVMKKAHPPPISRTPGWRNAAETADMAQDVRGQLCGVAVRL